MDIFQLLVTQQLNALTSPLETLSKIITHLIQRIRLQLDGMHAFFTIGQRLETRHDRRTGKQEDMWMPRPISCRQSEQRLQSRVIQQLSVIYQQVDLLPCQG